MSFSWFKHIVVFVCLFCMMEGAGISVLKLITHANIRQNEQQQANEDENTNERGEGKENRLKVLWSSDLDMPLPAISIIENKVVYPHEQFIAHLAWVPPVPTPPPDLLV